MPDTTGDFAKTVFEHAARLGEVVSPPDDTHGLPAVVVPQGWNLCRPKGWVPVNPDRIRTAVRLDTTESFCAYVTDFKGDGSRIFCEVSGDAAPNFAAHLDYHENAESPSWASHMACFRPTVTPNWREWYGKNRDAMPHEEFALFLEEHSLDVIDPAGADILQLVNAFEINGTIKFQRVQILSSGATTLHYVNETRGGAGSMTVPEFLTLRMPLYEGEEPAEFKARLRYRFKPADGTVSFQFQIVNVEALVRQTAEKVIERVSEATGLDVLRGTVVSRLSPPEFP